MRPVPVLRLHRTLNLYYVAFKVNGRRVCRYFGKVESDAAIAKYRAFCREWPRQLREPLPTRGTWPARRLIEHDGRTLSIESWARETGIKATTIRARLAAGWSVERTLTTPARQRLIEHDGRSLTLAGWSRITSITLATLKYRVQVLKWSPSKAFTTPVHRRKEAA